MTGLVIVGASYAGVQVAISAREKGYAERIRIIADEPQLPYQRPPLSKGYLAGAVGLSNLILRGQDYFDANGIEMLLGRRAIEIDRTASQLVLDNAERLTFEHLVLATGSRARRITVPGHDRDGILYLRTLDDADILKTRLADARSVVIIGGGFIGLEIAATAAKWQKQVNLIEASTRLLERAVSPMVSQYLLDLHRSHGVTIHLQQTVSEIGDGAGGMHRIECINGMQLEGDLIVVGVGGIANAELAAAAGIACSNGIDVDEYGRTSAAGIYAAGDCSNHFNEQAGTRVRLEAVQNATDQGRTIGNFIAGVPEPYRSVPRFWSDQYDAKLQTVGLAQPTDRPILRGRPADHRFSIFYYRDTRLVAVDSINRPGDQMIARRFIESGRWPTPEQAGDETFDLKGFERGL